MTTEPATRHHPHDPPVRRSDWRIRCVDSDDADCAYAQPGGNVFAVPPRDERRWRVLHFLAVGRDGVWVIRHWCATWEEARDWLVDNWELGRWWSL